MFALPFLCSEPYGDPSLLQLSPILIASIIVCLLEYDAV